MHPVFSHNEFLVKEHIGMFKAASNYDVYDPETGDQILQCRERHLGVFTKMLRFTDYKRMTPFNLSIETLEEEPLLRVSRGASFWRSKVAVHDDENDLLGYYRQKLMTIGGGFQVLSDQEEPMCKVKGSFTGWTFRFLIEDQEVAIVSKNWSGLGKEMFTSADTYKLTIDDSVPSDSLLRQLILGSVFCIDLVLKE